MPKLEGVNWGLLYEAVQATRRPEYRKRTGVTTSMVGLIREATEQAKLGNESPFTSDLELSAAASRILAASPQANSTAGRQTLDAFLNLTGQLMSELPHLTGRSQSTISRELRTQALLHESPEAFFALVWRSQNPHHPHIDFRPAPPADQLFSHRAFLTSFGLFHSPVPKVVRDHVLGTENLTRFDGLVREMTSTRGRPKGVSIEEGIRVLFHRDKLNDPIAEGAIEAAIQYNPKGEIRAPGSGINFFMTLNSLHTSTTEYLTSAYTQFSRGTGSNGEASLIDALQVYLQTTLGRHPSPEEIWAYLQKGRPGFPVRDAVIEALGVRPDEFDQVMQRAAKEGAFGEALRSSEFRSSRRRELLERR